MKNEITNGFVVLLMGLFAVCMASMLFFTATRQISISESALSELLTTIIILAATLTLYTTLHFYRPISAPTKLIAISIAIAVLLPSTYLCLTEFASQTINVFNWGSVIILAHILSSQLVPTTAKSQNPTHSG